MSKFTLFCLVVAAAFIGNTNAVTEESRLATQTFLIPIITECAKSMKIPEEEVKSAVDNNNMETLDGCMLACIQKKTGLLNAKGDFDLDTAIQIVNKVLKEEDKEQAIQINNGCLSVNDKPVTDGSKGCDRAKLLAQCYGLHKTTFRLV